MYRILYSLHRCCPTNTNPNRIGLFMRYTVGCLLMGIVGIAIGSLSSKLECILCKLGLRTVCKYIYGSLLGMVCMYCSKEWTHLNRTYRQSMTYITSMTMDMAHSQDPALIPNAIYKTMKNSMLTMLWLMHICTLVKLLYTGIVSLGTDITEHWLSKCWEWWLILWKTCELILFSIFHYMWTN